MEQPPHPMLGTHRVELVRLMLQTLTSMGLKRTADSLQEESGVTMQTEAVACFREQVLGGHWEDAHALVPALGLDASKTFVQYLLYKQHFLELLEGRDTLGAITVLRTHIAALAPTPSDLHKLAALVMCRTPLELCAKAQWGGTITGTSRSTLLRQLQSHISSSVLMQEHRLPNLLSQALASQVSSCLYHNVSIEHASLLSDHACTIRNVPQHTLATLTDHSDEVWYVAFSPNGKFLASCGKDTFCFVYNVADTTSGPLGRCEGHSMPVFQCVFDPVSSSVLTCSADSTIMRWTLSGAVMKTYIAHVDAVNAVAWNPDGLSFVSASDDKFMIRWDAASGGVLQRWHGSRVYDLAIHGTRLVTVDSEKRLCVHSLVHGDYVQALHPTSIIPPTPAIAEERSDDETGIVEVATLGLTTHGGHEPSVVREADNLTSLYLSGDGQQCLVNVSVREQIKGVIVLYDLATGKPIQRYVGQRQTKFVIRSCLGGAQQNFVLSGSEDNRVVVFHRASGRRLLALRGHSKIVSCVAWNPVQNNLLASASDDKTVRLWGCA